MLVIKPASARSTRARARAGGESISAVRSGAAAGIGGRTRSMRRSGADESTFEELSLGPTSVSPKAKRGRGRPSNVAVTKTSRARTTSRPGPSANSRRLRNKSNAGDERDGSGGEEGDNEPRHAQIARLSAQMQDFMSRTGELLVATAELLASVKETQKEIASLK